MNWIFGIVVGIPVLIYSIDMIMSARQGHPQLGYPSLGALYFGYREQNELMTWWTLRILTRVFVFLALYVLLLLPAMLSWLPVASTGPTYLPAKLDANKIGAFVTTMDAWANQLIALALALFLLIAWLFKNVVQGQERRNWPDTISLLLALVFTLWSVTAGMELKWFGFIMTGAVLFDETLFKPTAPAILLSDKAFMQGKLLLAALVLTLSCLPALWRKPRKDAAERTEGLT